MFRCPDSTTQNFDIIFSARASASMGMNSYLGWYFNYYQDVVCGYAAGCYPRPVSEPLITFPAVTALFTDGFDQTVNGRTPRGYWIDPSYGKGVRFGLSDRHSKGSNVALLDGHAKWYYTNRLLSQASINDTDPTTYYEKANYNAAGIIWDVDAGNPYTGNPNKWPTACCDTP